MMASSLRRAKKEAGSDARTREVELQRDQRIQDAPIGCALAAATAREAKTSACPTLLRTCTRYCWKAKHKKAFVMALPGSI